MTSSSSKHCFKVSVIFVKSMTLAGLVPDYVKQKEVHRITIRRLLNADPGLDLGQSDQKWSIHIRQLGMKHGAFSDHTVCKATPSHPPTSAVSQEVRALEAPQMTRPKVGHLEVRIRKARN